MKMLKIKDTCRFSFGGFINFTYKQNNNVFVYAHYNCYIPMSELFSSFFNGRMLQRDKLHSLGSYSSEANHGSRTVLYHGKVIQSIS